MPMHMLPNETYKTKHQRMNFSSGGTMWGLINDFKDFIYGDDDTNHNNGYGGLYRPHWGYPETCNRAWIFEIKARGVNLLNLMLN